MVIEMINNMQHTMNLIKEYEGFRFKPYLCTERYLTIGYGTKLINNRHESTHLYNGKFCCLTVTTESAEALLIDEIKKIEQLIIQNIQLEFFNNLSDNRQAVVISMCYQLGYHGFIKFKNTIKYLQDGRYKKASQEMLNSRWSKQTPRRAKEHSELILMG